MLAVSIDHDVPGGALRLEQTPDPEPAAGEVVIEIAAAGVNRADLSQRAGRYPPPPGASAVPGLECAGVVTAVGPGAEGHFSLGDRVAALLAGGGYAQRVAVPAGQVLPAPRNLSLEQAGALPEALATVWANLFDLGRAVAGERLLVHGGASGIGTTAIQLARWAGLDVLTTVGNRAKADLCRSLGARVAIDYHREDFVERVLQETDGQGVDVVLDLVGADYLDRNVQALAKFGRLVVFGIQSGSLGSLDLRPLMAKRGLVTGSTLRARSVAEKSEVVASVRRAVLPLIERGGFRPVIDATYDLADVELAHRRLSSPDHAGKVVLLPPGAWGTQEAASCDEQPARPDGSIGDELDQTS